MSLKESPVTKIFLAVVDVQIMLQEAGSLPAIVQNQHGNQQLHQPQRPGQLQGQLQGQNPHRLDLDQISHQLNRRHRNRRETTLHLTNPVMEIKTIRRKIKEIRTPEMTRTPQTTPKVKQKNISEN